MEVARLFRLSRSRIYLIERKAKADKVMAERRERLFEIFRAADDPHKMWPLGDLFDAMNLRTPTRNSLGDHFARKGADQVSLRDLTNMCLGEPYMTAMEYAMPSLTKVRGIGPISFWEVVNGLTEADFGKRCNAEWRERLPMVKWVWRNDPFQG